MTFEEVVAAHRGGEYEKAERGYLSFADHPHALYNLAVLYGAWGKRSASERFLRATLEKSPGHAMAEYGLATLCLEDGRWGEGWQRHEARRRLGAFGEPGMREPGSAPEWQGERLRGKHILVVGEQGFGDQIMFGRFAKVLQGAAGRVTYACSASLVTLVQNAGLEAIDRSSPVSATPDYWVFVGSVPLRLGLTPDCVPPPLAFDLTPNGRGLAVCPSGNPKQRNDANRSLRGADAARLLTMGRDVRPEATGAKDFLETARLLCSFGALASVDTSIAHLGASLGLPTVVLLTARGVDWRWGLSGDTSPWYPEATLIRRDAGGWTGALDRVEQLRSDNDDGLAATASSRTG